MDRETSKELCHCLAKAYSTAVRLYLDSDLLYYYSSSNITPDPILPHLSKILACKAKAGIITTELYQFYGFLTLPSKERIIIGPTRILDDNKRNIELLLAMLKIKLEEKEDYLKLLYSAPIISCDRFAWLISSLMTALCNKAFPVENVWFNIRAEDTHHVVQSQYELKQLKSVEDESIRQSVNQSYAWEQLIVSYVENGEVNLLKEIFSAPPNIKAGRIAHDSLRQIKNMGICTATGVSRAAIRGGLDPQLAFSMSDLYIQRLELMRDLSNIEKLIQDMILDFAEQVERLNCPTGGGTRFFKLCATYISDNLFNTIRAEAMAKSLGYTRAYLCTRFKKEAGISLISYIQKEKIAEAKKLLQFTDQSLGQIAATLSFSSQSHFQTVFRKIAGETPMAFRLRNKGTNPKSLKIM